MTSGAVRRKIDHIDRQILAALRRNCKLTIAELSERVGISHSPCWTRLKRLESEGAIRGYVALIDAGFVGRNEIFFVEITLDHHDERMLESFGPALARMPEVLEAHLVTGDYDYLVKIAVADRAEYERFLRQSLYRIPGIKSTRSAFALRELKWEASVEPL